MPLRPARYDNAVASHICVDGAAKAIEFYKRAFGAEVLFAPVHPDGRIAHGELLIYGAVVMIGDPDQHLGVAGPAQLGRTTSSLHLFLDDNVAAFERAVASGATAIQPPTEMPFGASAAVIRDPFGHVWVLLQWKTLDKDPVGKSR